MSRAKSLSKTRAPASKGPKSRAAAGTGPFLTGKRLNIILCVLLVAATIALYSPVIGHSFIVMDDSEYVTANPHIHRGLAWSTIKWAFVSTEEANWHPLTWLSHALDYQLFALNPAGHHADSVLIHALNAVLLFLLLRWVTKRVGPSLLAAALFAFHPFNVESVAWVAERKNVLSTLFFLLAIGAYVRYVQRPEWRRYLVVAALFAAGLMAKPMVITLPFVLLLLDYWPLGRTAGSPPSALAARQFTVSRLLLEKIPLLVLSAASAWITLVAQRPAERTFEEFPLGVRIENAVVAYGMYLWKMLWPARLAKYPHPGDTLAVWPIIASALILVGVTALVVVFRRKRYLPVGWFWFLGTLVPVIGLVQVGDAAMADRYAYVPLIGIFVMIAWGAADLAEAKRVRAAWLVITALCVLTALGFVTHRQMSYWDSEFNLWSHTLAATDPEQSAFAHDALGSALLAPETTMTPQSLENFDSQEKRLGEARRHMERALELRRELAKRQRSIFLLGMATTLNNLGNLDRLENRTGEARQHYEEALQIHSQLSQQNHDPYSEHIATMLNNLGALEKDSKRADEAYQHFEGALGIYRHLAQQYPDTYLPKVAETLNNLGFVEREQRRMDEARRDYEEALKIRRQLAQQDPDAYVPYLATTLNDLGILDGVQHRMDDARRHYEEALQTYRQLAKKDPDTYRRYVAATLNNLAFLDELQNRIEEARIHYHEALKIYRELYESDPNSYGGDVARVDLRLEQLDKKGPSQ